MNSRQLARVGLGDGAQFVRRLFIYERKLRLLSHAAIRVRQHLDKLASGAVSKTIGQQLLHFLHRRALGQIRGS